MTTRRRAAIAVLLIATLGATLAGCQTARVGRRCSGTGFAQDATNVLQCRNGRWRVLMTKAQYVQLLIAIRNNNTTTTTPATTAPTTTAAPTTTTTTTTTTTPPPAAYAIASGYQSTCAVIAGAVKCVGDNPNGDLGNGTFTDSVNWVSTGITDATAVAAGSNTGCALRTNGTVWCWGFGGFLGNGLTSPSNVPVQVTGITDATQISSGSNGSCARTAAGLVKCWGLTAVRGDGGSGTAFSPVTATIANVAKVSVGGLHACTLKTDGTIWCWGNNPEGQLGDNTTTSSSTPVQVSGLTGMVDVAAGGMDGASCGVKSNGTAWCWGDDGYAQMGDGNGSTTDYLVPTQVVTITDASKVTVGFYHACALRSTGAVKCWGFGGYLGDGLVSTSTTPVDVNGITNAATLSAQATTTCALLATNGAKCWGNNGFGQAGSGNTASALTPLTVLGMP